MIAKKSPERKKNGKSRLMAELKCLRKKSGDCKWCQSKTPLNGALEVLAHRERKNAPIDVKIILLWQGFKEMSFGDFKHFLEA